VSFLLLLLLLAGMGVAHLLLQAARASEAAADSECHYSDMSEASVIVSVPPLVLPKASR